MQKTQEEIVRLLNKWAEGYETELLEKLAEWTNNNFISIYKIEPNETRTK
jgi:hypothetical protein